MKKNYSKDLDLIVALISFLSMTKYKSMKPSSLSLRLSLDTNNVLEVLNKYKAIFRRSTALSENGENYYTLHLRYALRWQAQANVADERDETMEAQTLPLPPEYLTTIIEFVSKQVAREENRKYQLTIGVITLIAAIIAAVASIWSATIK